MHSEQRRLPLFLFTDQQQICASKKNNARCWTCNYSKEICDYSSNRRPFLHTARSLVRSLQLAPFLLLPQMRRLVVYSMALLIRSRLHFYHFIQVAKNDNSRINRHNNRGWPHHHNWRVSLQSPQQEHRNSLSFPLLRAASSVMLLVIKKRKILNI